MGPLDVTLWIVGRHLYESDAWEFQGVFTSQEFALAACRDRSYFIAPAILDEIHSHESVPWPGAYYPLAAEEGDEGREQKADRDSGVCCSASAGQD